MGGIPLTVLTLTGMGIPPMLDTDTLTMSRMPSARGLLSPLLLPNPDTDTTVTDTDTDTLMATLTDTHHYGKRSAEPSAEPGYAHHAYPYAHHAYAAYPYAHHGYGYARYPYGLYHYILSDISKAVS